MNVRVLAFPLAVLLVAGGVALVARGEAPAAPPAPPAIRDDSGNGKPKPRGAWHPQNVRVVQGPKTEKFPCRVRAPEPLDVLPGLRGTPVEKILVKEGDAVTKGDVLLTFLAAPWERALAAAEKARDEKGIAEAKSALASLEVRAPADGIVYAVNARRGEMPILGRERPIPLVIRRSRGRCHADGVTRPRRPARSAGTAPSRAHASSRGSCGPSPRV